MDVHIYISMCVHIYIYRERDTHKNIKGVHMHIYICTHTASETNKNSSERSFALVRGSFGAEDARQGGGPWGRFRPHEIGAYTGHMYAQIFIEHTYTNMYVHIYIYIYSHINMDIYIYICMYLSVFVLYINYTYIYMCI